VFDISSMHNSNLVGNGAHEAIDNIATGSSDRDMTGNYWGGANTALLAAGQPFDNMPFLTDVQDGSGNHLINVWGSGRDYLTTASLNSPTSSTPAFLLGVTPDASNPVCAGPVVFTLTFSEAMNTSFQPTVTFDSGAPYTKNVVVADPGWVDSTTWRGSFAFDLSTGDGTHTIRVSGATSADGFEIPDDTIHKFTVDTSGGTIANNGIATIIGTTQVMIAWDSARSTFMSAKETVSTPTAGFNVLRSTTGLPGSYRQLNTTLIPNSGGPKTTYFDFTLTAGTQYFWLVYRVDTSGNSEVWSGPITNTATEVDVQDGSTPIVDGSGSVDFGAVIRNGSTLTKTFTVYNYGYGTLSTSNLSVGSPFTITEGLAATIPAGGSDSFTVSLPTSTAGTFNGTVSFTTNDADENPYNFTITGVVTAPDATLVWVKFDFAGAEYGTQSNPYNTLAEGIGTVNAGGTVRIFAGSTPGAYRITKHSRLEAFGGVVHIGRATGLADPSQTGESSDDSTGTPGRTPARNWILYQ
jgi:hypothetical protein